MVRIALIASLVALGGCATITRGTSEMVEITSAPPGATVTTDIGLGCPATPCRFEVSRKTPFVATFALPGYQTQTVGVIVEGSGAGMAGFAGNIVFGGIIGVGTDLTTGATQDHKPNPVHAIMVPLPPEPPATVRPAGPRARPAKPVS